MSRKKRSAVSTKSKLAFIFNDAHFPMHDVPTWNAMVKCIKDLKPDQVIGNGDLIDFNMLSSFPQEREASIYAIDQIRSMVEHINPLTKHCNKVTFLQGNHDDRWNKIIGGSLDPRLKGARGLSLEDQCYNQGLDKKINWVEAEMISEGVQLGPFTIRHGDKQCRGRFGGGKHLCATRLANSMGKSEIVGHFHRAQMFCQSSHDRGDVIVIANPCMTGDHGYAHDPNWQRGFTIVEMYGPDNMYATAHLIVVNKGHFAFAGKVYDGNV